METVIYILEGVGIFVLLAAIIYVLFYFLAVRGAKTLTEMGISEKCGDCNRLDCKNCPILTEEQTKEETNGGDSAHNPQSSGD